MFLLGNGNWTPGPGQVEYIGTFRESYTIDNGQTQLSGTLSFRLTIIMQKIVTIMGMTTYRIVAVQSSQSYFGARFLVTPLAGSVAILPSPALNVSNQNGEGFTIFFPNATTLVTDNTAGAMHMSSDGRTISNSLDPTIQPHTWTAGGPGLNLEDTLIPVDGGRGTNYNCVTDSSWSLVMSAL